MLNVVLIDLVSEKSISKMLHDLYRQRELPIKRILSYTNISSCMSDYSEIEAMNINVLMVSVDTLEQPLMDVVYTLRDAKPHMHIVFFMPKGLEWHQVVTPALKVSGILFVPLEPETLSQVIVEVYKALVSSKASKDNVFSIKIGADYYCVDVNTIRYFEARGKKIALNTLNQEILFYSNFETLLSALPDWFIRCHKGFIVNTHLIVNARFSEMCVELAEGLSLPISRTFKESLKAIMERKRSV